MKNIEIIRDLRRDFASLYALILHLQKLRQYSIEQQIAIESLRSSFGFIQCWPLCQLRQRFGDDNWQKLEEIDKPKPILNPSYNSMTVIFDVKEKAQELQRKLLNLPGENGCDSSQSAVIDKLQDALRWWRNIELKQLLECFE